MRVRTFVGVVIATNLLVSLLSSVSAQQQQQQQQALEFVDLPNDLRWTSLSEFIQRIRFSEAQREFGSSSSSSTAAETLFDAATRFEWRRALTDIDRLYPSVACRSLDNDIRSGFRAKQNLENLIDEKRL